jgi:hypothetical protein
MNTTPESVTDDTAFRLTTWADNIERSFHDDPRNSGHKAADDWQVRRLRKTADNYAKLQAAERYVEVYDYSMFDCRVIERRDDLSAALAACDEKEAGE